MASSVNILSSYITNINTAIECQNGQQFSSYLDLSQDVISPSDAMSIRQSFQSKGQLQNICNRILSGNFAKIVFGHCQCMHLMASGLYVEAFEEQSEALNAFLAEMSIDRPDKTNWWLRPINTVMITFRIVAFKADDHNSANTGHSKPIYAIQVPDVLQKFFRRMIQDRSAFNVSKIAGALFTVNEMLKVYFHINNLRLCTQTIRTVEGQTFPALENFPKSQTVTYNYFLGRLKLFDEQYDQAEKSLEWAFVHCHKNSWSNKRRILEFLVPVKLYLGKFPQIRLLDKFKLQHFRGLVTAVHCGRLDWFERELHANEELYIKKGVFLTLEQLKTFVYRNMFMKALSVQQSRPNNIKKSLLPFEVLHFAMSINGRSDIDGSELECITANLIYDKYLKGYIAHQRGIMVSQTDPFPALSRAPLL
uniref:PCI domain-containing protein n=1 Tax=Spongospora subterranea TaxID=70186 RepID=A0A0H5R9Q0_9EUKA|eukprot:CRZ10521.1 hypothetical protein [Spongospora subterranea]